MVRRALFWRVRSALIQWVSVKKDSKASCHAIFHRFTSGQLRFLGSISLLDATRE
jgi:hypothetical protein